MHIKPELDIRQAQMFIHGFISITGWRAWEKRLNGLQDQVRSNPSMKHYLDERFELELAFSDIRKRPRLTGNYVVKEEVAAEYRFLTFACMVSKLYLKLNSKGQTRLKGMLMDALKSDYGLAPLAYEISIAAHLMTLGFDVEFSDLEGKATYDLLATNSDVRMEIECKFISADVGRKIHRRRLFQMGGVLGPRLQRLLENSGSGLLVRLTLPDRLRGCERQHEELSGLVCRAIEAKKLSDNSGKNRVTLQQFPLVGSPFGNRNVASLDQSDVEHFLSERFGLDSKNVMIVFKPGDGAIVLAIESAIEDAVLRGILKQLKGAAKRQFSGSLPAILCCQLADVSETELRSLESRNTEGTGLDHMTTKLIQARSQLLSVAYSVSGSIQQRPVVHGGLSQTAVKETGPVYVINNPEHPLAEDKGYDIFGISG